MTKQIGDRPPFPVGEMRKRGLSRDFFSRLTGFYSRQLLSPKVLKPARAPIIALAERRKLTGI